MKIKMYWLLGLGVLAMGLGCEKKPQPVTGKSERDSRPGPVTAEDLKRKVRETFELTRAYARDTSATYEKKIRGELKDLSGKMEELRKRSAGSGAKAKEDSRRLLAELQKKKEALEGGLKRLPVNSGPALESARAKIDAALRELKEKSRTAAERAKQGLTEKQGANEEKKGPNTQTQ